MIPDLGPLKVLCVVEVTTSANGTGEGYRSAATNPDTWAISTKKYAPTSSAISLNFFQSIIPVNAENPAIISLGLCSFARDLTSS